MKLNKIINNIKTLPMFIKKHPKASPSDYMHRIIDDAQNMSDMFYRSVIINFASYYNGKNNSAYTIITREDAKKDWSTDNFNRIKDSVKPHEFFIEKYNNAQYPTRPLTTHDVLKARKRVLLALKKITPKVKHVALTYLGHERAHGHTLSGHNFYLSTTDLVYILHAYHLSEKHSEYLTYVAHKISKFLTGDLDSSASISFKIPEISVIIYMMQKSQAKMFKQLSLDDEVTWFNIITKLCSFIHDENDLMDKRNNNRLLQNSLMEMFSGNVNFSLNVILKNSSMNSSCLPVFHDALSHIAYNTMMNGIKGHDMFINLNRVQYILDTIKGAPKYMFPAVKKLQKAHCHYVHIIDDGKRYHFKPIDKYTGSILDYFIFMNYLSDFCPDYQYQLN